MRPCILCIIILKRGIAFSKKKRLVFEDGMTATYILAQVCHNIETRVGDRYSYQRLSQDRILNDNEVNLRCVYTLYIRKGLLRGGDNDNI